MHITMPVNEPKDFSLSVDGGKLSLMGISVDFDDIDMRLIKKSARNSNQPIAKAVGKQTTTVVDLTCGLGKDAYLLLCMGYKVIGIERNPIVFQLLKDGVDRAIQSPEHQELLMGSFTLIQTEAMEFVRNLKEKPDAFYIDPMYPPRSTSALPKKEIQVLRELLSSDLAESDQDRDNNLNELLDLCLKKTQKRVVLKRPIWLLPLRKPKISFQGKLVRYDVYL